MTPDASFKSEKDSNGVVSARKYFEYRGVFFPKGAFVKFDAGICRIIARNTPGQLRRISVLISDVNVVDPQVLVTVKYLKIPEKDFNKINKTKALSPTDGNILSKSAEVIASASVLVQNGEEAEIQLGNGVHFPESWLVGNARASEKARKTA